MKIHILRYKISVIRFDFACIRTCVEFKSIIVQELGSVDTLDDRVSSVDDGLQTTVATFFSFQSLQAGDGQRQVIRILRLELFKQFIAGGSIF